MSIYTRACQSQRGGAATNRKPRACEACESALTAHAVDWFVEVPAGIAPAYGGFADPCLTTWLRHHRKTDYQIRCSSEAHSFFSSLFSQSVAVTSLRA